MLSIPEPVLIPEFLKQAVCVFLRSVMTLGLIRKRKKCFLEKRSVKEVGKHFPRFQLL